MSEGRCKQPSSRITHKIGRHSSQQLKIILATDESLLSVSVASPFHDTPRRVMYEQLRHTSSAILDAEHIIITRERSNSNTKTSPAGTG